MNGLIRPIVWVITPLQVIVYPPLILYHVNETSTLVYLETITTWDLILEFLILDWLMIVL